MKSENERSLTALAECDMALLALNEIHGKNQKLAGHLGKMRESLNQFALALVFDRSKKPNPAKKEDNVQKPPKTRSADKRPPTAPSAPAPLKTSIVCGESYLRKGPAQKCCSAECLNKKRSGLDRDGNPLKDKGESE